MEMEQMARSSSFKLQSCDNYLARGTNLCLLMVQCVAEQGQEWCQDKLAGTDEERRQRYEDDQAAIKNVLEQTLQEVDGKVVGVMGFSLGGGVAAALLQRTQQLKLSSETGDGRAKAWGDLEFGVFLMGLPPAWYSGDFGDSLTKIKLPTVHVNGLRDPWLEPSQTLLTHYCEGSIDDHFRLEFDVGHEVNFTDEQHKCIVDAILNAAARGKESERLVTDSGTIKGDRLNWSYHKFNEAVYCLPSF
jgi:hypothetical protein